MSAALPELTVRASTGRWVPRLVASGVLVVAGAGALLGEIVPEGIPRASSSAC